MFIMDWPITQVIVVHMDMKVVYLKKLWQYCIRLLHHKIMHVTYIHTVSISQVLLKLSISLEDCNLQIWSHDLLHFNLHVLFIPMHAVYFIRYSWNICITTPWMKPELLIMITCMYVLLGLKIHQFNAFNLVTLNVCG